MDIDLRRRRQEATSKAIRDGGFYGRSGVWNSIVTLPNDKKLYRKRVETIIVKNGKEVYVKKKLNGEYFLPGGSTEKDIPDINQAINECNEEAHINIKNIESTGITYTTIRDTPEWAKLEGDVVWQGTITDVYIAEYDGKFTGKVDKVDEDPFINSGRWYSTKECFKFFNKYHRNALLWYLKLKNEQDEEVVNESYISNYFKNKKLLKKISHNPEIERAALDQMISMLKKEYSELSMKSKIKRERKKADVNEIFHPVVSLDFTDGTSITVAICFDDKEISDGCAIQTEDYGEIVVVYPKFFDTTKDNQIFTLLHEIGHIRLNHLDTKHRKGGIFSDKSMEHRLQVMRKGKAVYPEVNADLYAILNGASMYTILDAAIRQDTDGEYDFRFTNSELATRYHKVFNKYGKLRGFTENSPFSEYDIACLAVYEMVYNNPDLDNLTTEMKNDLYDILYEYGINHKIKDDKSLIALTEKYNDLVDEYDEKRNQYSAYLESSGDNEYKYIIEEFEDKLNEAYCSLYNTRCYLYEKAIDKDITEPSNIGNNSKVAYIAQKKEDFINEMTDLMVTFQEKLEEKKGSTDDLKVERFLYIIDTFVESGYHTVPIDYFGIPETRSYPLNSRKRTLSAIKLFSRAPEEYKKELAGNIKKRMVEWKIPMDVIGEENPIREYL